MNVLAVIHGDDAPAGTFGDVVRERGHTLVTWTIGSEARPAGDHDAVMLFGGAMHADQEADHPWLMDEDVFIRDLLDRRVPLLGVCLGAQLVAKAAGADVLPAAAPEIGWCEVERTSDGDPVLDVLPRRFPAFQWHYYAFEVPADGLELARSPLCPQAFRLGEAAWGVQFHPEVTREIVASWVDESPEDAPAGLPAETDERIDEWMRLGRALCGAFLDAADRQ